MRKQGRTIRWLIAGAVLALAIVGLALPGLSDFDVAGRTQRELTFDSGGAGLSGTLLLPGNAGERPRAVVLLVHGDGPQDRFSAGGYLPLVNALLDDGIAVFTWDKPGIGASTGDWLSQSMQDRADEARAALSAVADSLPQAGGRIGFLGFSQAGWVLPRLASTETDAGFFVLVGGAVNWQRQGDYFTARRLEAEGWTPERIAGHLIDADRRETELFSGLATGTLAPGEAARRIDVTPERLAFIARNRHEDASTDIARIDRPFMAIWGERDLNVNPRANAADYRRLHLPARPSIVTMLPGATHGLLRASLFNYQLPDQMPWHARAAFVVLGRNAYAPGAIASMSEWIRKVTEE